MKLIKLSEEHYIGVHKSTQPVNGLYYDAFLKAIRNTSGAEYGECNHCWKITHSTQPIENVMGTTNDLNAKGWVSIKRLFLSEVKELLNVVDVEKIAFAQFGGSQDNKTMDAFTDGYNQALEDNKEKKYTKEDMVEWAMCMIAQYVQGNTNIWDKGMLFESLPKPKTEWEVEFIDGKLKLV